MQYMVTLMHLGMTTQEERYLLAAENNNEKYIMNILFMVATSFKEKLNNYGKKKKDET